jgi:hypothetical protein
MPSPVNVGLNTIRYDILTTDFSPPLPATCLESNLHFDWTYSGGTNANFSTTDGCGSSTGNIVRATSGNSFGGGQVAVVISARGPSNACPDCGLSCWQLSGVADPGTRARPGKEMGTASKNTTLSSPNNVPIQTFPDSAKRFITLNFSKISNTDWVEVYDSAGRRWKTFNPNQKKVVLNVRKFPPGWYSIKYHCNETFFVIGTFQKKK